MWRRISSGSRGCAASDSSRPCRCPLSNGCMRAKFGGSSMSAGGYFAANSGGGVRGSWGDVNAVYMQNGWSVGCSCRSRMAVSTKISVENPSPVAAASGRIVRRSGRSHATAQRRGPTSRRRRCCRRHRSCGRRVRARCATSPHRRFGSPAVRSNCGNVGISGFIGYGRNAVWVRSKDPKQRAAGQEHRPAGHADRVGRGPHDVGARERGTGGGQGIERGRVHGRIAQRPDGVVPMVVGDQEQEVRRHGPIAERADGSA